LDFASGGGDKEDTTSPGPKFEPMFSKKLNRLITAPLCYVASEHREKERKMLVYGNTDWWQH
jgi:hypothetical protein